MSQFPAGAYSGGTVSTFDGTTEAPTTATADDDGSWSDWLKNFKIAIVKSDSGTTVDVSDNGFLASFRGGSFANRLSGNGVSLSVLLVFFVLLVLLVLILRR